VRRHAQREPNGGGCDAVVIDRMTLDPKGPSPYSPPTPTPPLVTCPKINTQPLCRQLPVAGVERIEVFQGPLRAPVNLGLV